MVSTRRRAVQRDKAYCAGDKIEVVRTDGLDVGILLRKEEDEDSADSSSVTHWLVSVEGGENVDEWISEKQLGRVLEANDSSDDNSGTMSTSSKPSATTMKKSNKKKSNNGGSNNKKVTATKKTTSSKHSKPKSVAAAVAATSTSSNNNNNNKNQKGKSSSSSSRSSNRRITTRSAAANSGKSVDVVEGLDNIDTLISKKVPTHRPKPKKEKDDETVVEVKMLTGTLFIYRGRRRRVEFIRTS